MSSPLFRRAVARPTLSLALIASFGFGLGCTPGESAGNSGGSSGTGSGGKTNTTGSGGASTTGTGGASTTGSGGASTTGSGGASTTGSGGASTTGSGGANTTGSGGANTTGSGGANTTGSGGASTTGSGGRANTGGTGTATGGSGTATGGSGAGTGGAGGGSGCSNTNMDAINLDASGFVCNNKWGIQGAWYCYSDGSDTSTSCKGSDGKGAGAIPWNAGSSAMCLSGTMGAGSGDKYAGIGFKVNSGPPGSTAAPGVWNGSGKAVGFAITLASGPSGKGTSGMILNLEYPTTDNLDPQSKDAPGVTLPGVGGSMITYNVLFADAVLANNVKTRTSVDPTKLTDVKLAFFPDSVSHTYDFCIKSIVPLMTAPSPVVAPGAYGPPWNNQTGQAVNGVNGYAVQSAPFPMNGNPMTMQVTATAGGVGFTYTTGSGFQAPNNGPGSFPAIISGWGPGHNGVQFYGPYKTAKKVSQLTSIKSSWSYTMGSSGNAVFDLWFGNSATPVVPNAELMIWIGNKDKMPIGYGTAAGAAIDGRTPYTGMNGTQEKVVSYWVPTGTTGTANNFDILQYVKDAAAKGYAGITNDSYMIGVQTGFEVYSGTWTTTDYNITIQ